MVRVGVTDGGLGIRFGSRTGCVRLGIVGSLGLHHVYTKHNS